MSLNRRDFLRTTTIAAVAPMIVPRHVVAGSQATPPSDRITIGHIGVGRMGGGHVQGFLKMPDARILAISDVRLETLERAQGRVNQQYGDSKCAAHPDYRELLARPDIDAVVVATGERWHPLISMEAARRGKHIYCEKPLSVTLAEGLALRAAVQKYGVVFQWGTQQRSSANYRLTAELVCEERVTYRQGTDDHTRTEEILRRELAVRTDQVPGTVSGEVTVAVPVDVPPSMALHHNGIAWSVVVRVEVPGVPVDTGTFAIAVLPRVSR